MRTDTPFCAWKPNWLESRRHFVDWWNHTGLVLGGWGAPPLPVPRDPTPLPPAAGGMPRQLDVTHVQANLAKMGAWLPNRQVPGKYANTK